MKRMITILTLLLPILLCATDWTPVNTPVLSMLTQLDNTGRAWRTTEILKEQYVNGSYNAHTKFTYSYSAVNPTLPDTIFVRYWDTENSVWTTGTVYKYVLNAAGDRLLSFTRSQTHDQTLIPLDFFSFSYDSQNRLSEYVYNEFNLNDMMLHERSRFYYSYPEGQGLQIVQVQYYPESELIDYHRTDYSFDAQGRIMGSNRYSCSDSLSWSENLRTYLTYHTNDTTDYASTIEYISQNHPYQALTFGLFEPPYVSNGMLGTYMSKYWNGVEWYNNRMHIYNYNLQDQLLTFQIKLWGDDDWLNYKNNLFTYLTNGNLNQQVEYEWNGSNYQTVCRYTFTWNEYTSAEDNTVPPLAGIRMHTSPNPFADELSICTESDKTAPAVISVYNAKGQLVRNLETRTNARISWDGKDNKGSAVGNGVFLLRLSTSGMSSSAKVLRIK